MINRIRKRDGRYVKFNKDKISISIKKAFNATNIDITENKLDRLVDKVIFEINKNYELNHRIPAVEEIQDIVEKTLMSSNFHEVAKKYIIYRNERFKIRDKNNRLMQTYKKFSEEDNNHFLSAQAEIIKYGLEGIGEFYKLFVLNNNHLKAHENGDIFIHNIEFLKLSFDSVNIDLNKLFEKGFYIGPTFIRPPQKIESFAALAARIIQVSQNELFGTQSFGSFDTFMARGIETSFKRLFLDNLSRATSFLNLPYDFKAILQDLERNKNIFPKLAKKDIDKYLIKYIDQNLIDKIYILTEKDIMNETEKAIEAFFYSLNTFESRESFKLPLSCISYGTDQSEEGRLITKTILRQTQMGLGKSKIPSLPIQIFKVKKGVNLNPEDKNYDLLKLAVETSAQFLYPNFSFQDTKYNFNRSNKYINETNYLGINRISNSNTTYGVGNLFTTTINIPRIALKFKNKKDFFMELIKIVTLTCESLLERYEMLTNISYKHYNFLAGQNIILPKSENDNTTLKIRDGNISVGFFGISEALKILNGYHHGENEDSLKDAKLIFETINNVIDRYKKNYQLNFVLSAIEDKNLINNFYEIDDKEFNLKNKNIFKYSNSFFLPKEFIIDNKSMIDLMSNFFKYTKGGHILHLNLSSLDFNTRRKEILNLIKYLSKKEVGLVSFNFPLYYDPFCGYLGNKEDKCKKCNRYINDDFPLYRIRRINNTIELVKEEKNQ